MKSSESLERVHLGKSIVLLCRSASLSVFMHSSDSNLPCSEVHRARSRKTGALVALKKIIMHNEKDGVCGPLSQCCSFVQS